MTELWLFKDGVPRGNCEFHNICIISKNMHVGWCFQNWYLTHFDIKGLICDKNSRESVLISQKDVIVMLVFVCVSVCLSVSNYVSVCQQPYFTP